VCCKISKVEAVIIIAASKNSVLLLRTVWPTAHFQLCAAVSGIIQSYLLLWHAFIIWRELWSHCHSAVECHNSAVPDSDCRVQVTSIHVNMNKSQHMHSYSSRETIFQIWLISRHTAEYSSLKRLYLIFKTSPNCLHNSVENLEYQSTKHGAVQTWVSLPYFQQLRNGKFNP
jgi:hypothetical protein